MCGAAVNAEDFSRAVLMWKPYSELSFFFAFKLFFLDSHSWQSGRVEVDNSRNLLLWTPW